MLTIQTGTVLWGPTAKNILFDNAAKSNAPSQPASPSTKSINQIPICNSSSVQVHGCVLMRRNWSKSQISRGVQH